jgi:hypothetical protein
MEPDLWWQLASGRWMWIHRAILRQETFSYTAAGEPWRYSVASELLFYALHRLGGFPLLLLLSPLACLGVTCLLRGRRALISTTGPGALTRAWTVAVALPVIGQRIMVRAELFTMVMLPIFLIVLWNEHLRHEEGSAAPSPSEGRDWLWLLPLLMIAWVNLHPGFVLGLALMGLFALRHPRRLIPWTIATAAATLVNPFGWHIYDWIGSLLSVLPLPDAARSLLGQPAPSTWRNFVAEVSPTAVSWTVIWDALHWHDLLTSSMWLLVFLAAAAAMAGLYYRRPWGSLVLALALPCALARLRFWGEFAVCTAVIAPDLLVLAARSREGNGAGQAKFASRFTGAIQAKFASRFTGGRFSAAGLRTISALLLIAFCSVCSADFVSNRLYFETAGISSFGLGLARPPADRAIQFIRDNHLPGRIFNPYGAGGYLTWAAAPIFEGQPDGYPVFVDGRGDPYGPSVIYTAMQLGGQSPSSEEWRWAIRQWNIRTVVALVSRQTGIEGIAAQAFCDSHTFRLAYLDESMAVFAHPEDLRTPPLDCQTVQIAPPAATASRWDRYNTYAIAGKIYFTFGRCDEAERAWRQAAAVAGEIAEMHLNFGHLREAQRRLGEAEREYRMAVRDFPSAQTYRTLGGLLTAEGRAPEAVECLRASAARDARPFAQWLMIAGNELASERPQEALDAIDRAIHFDPYQGDAVSMGLPQMVELLAMKGQALLALKRPQEAVQAFETCWQMSPGSGQPADFQIKWAEAYRAAGRPADAERVLQRSGMPLWRRSSK